MPVKKIQKKRIVAKTENHLTKQIKAVLLFAAAIFIFAGIQFTAQTGWVGFVINQLLRLLFGEAALAVPILFAFIAFGWSFQLANYANRLTGLAIIFLVLLITLHLRLAMIELPDVAGGEFYRSILNLGLEHKGGGVFGALFTITLLFLFRDLGSYIIIGALWVVAILLLTNFSLADLAAAAAKPVRYLINAGVYCWRKIFSGDNSEKKEETEEQTDYAVRQYDDIPLAAQLPEEKELIEDHKEFQSQEEEIAASCENPEETGSAPLPHLLLTAPLDERKTTTQIEENEQENGQMLNGVLAINSQPESYIFPPLNLLSRVVKLRDFQQQKVIQERARVLEKTFASFGVKVKIKEIQAGPAVTRYEIQPETGVKVSRILSLSNDLALNMAAPHVRIEAPIPGKAAVGVEVPNKIISLVYIREVLEDSNFKESPSPLLIGLGKDIAGTAVFADLLKMPHLLIAGSTGSGKSVCINTLICSILYKAEPWIVKFLLIDPKMVELYVYNGIPHLVLPVVTDAKKAAIALRGMVREMERRYDLFARQGVRDIGRYNELSQENTLPYIVVVIDELSDLMMVSPSEVEDSIVRLSQMSRAAGIHLVIATQRPSVDVITGLIKANITSRIAFAVSSQTDSRTILDLGGAEKLLGRGDMLYHPLGIHKPLRIQGAFVSEGDIFKVVEFIKQQGTPHYQQAFFDDTGTDEIPARERDELLPEVVDLMLHAGHASISLIQRRFRIGYTRAARIIDDLERLGIIGKYEGSKPRQILISREQADKILTGKIDQS